MTSLTENDRLLENNTAQVDCPACPPLSIIDAPQDRVHNGADNLHQRGHNENSTYVARYSVEKQSNDQRDAPLAKVRFSPSVLRTPINQLRPLIINTDDNQRLKNRQEDANSDEFQMAQNVFVSKRMPSWMIESNVQFSVNSFNTKQSSRNKAVEISENLPKQADETMNLDGLKSEHTSTLAFEPAKFNNLRQVLFERVDDKPRFLENAAEYIKALVSGCRLMSQGKCPPKFCTARVAQLLSAKQLATLIRKHPRLVDLLVANNATANSAKGREQRRSKSELKHRKRLLSRIVHGRDKALQRLFYIPESVRLKASWELRLLKLRQFQALLRFQILNEGRQLENPVSSNGSTVKDFLLHHFQKTARHDIAQSKNEAKMRSNADTSTTRCVDKGLPSSIFRKVSKQCSNNLKKPQTQNEILRVRLNHLTKDLALHYKQTRKAWMASMERNKSIALDTCRRVEAVLARKEALRERDRKHRMKLLKENDFDKYLELVKQSKNARIEELLNQTDRFLQDVSVKVASQQKATSKAQSEQQTRLGGSGSLFSLPSFGPQQSECKKSDSPQTKQTEEDFNEALPDQRRSSSGLSAANDFYRNVVEQGLGEVVVQPSILSGGTLMAYQLAGLQFLVNLYCSNLSGILADEMGLGKTIQTIGLLAYLKEFKGIEGPHLIIVPLSTLPNWIAEFEKWCPSLSIIQFRGTKLERRVLAQNVKKGTFNVCVTTYDWIIREKGTLSTPYWTFIIVDEGHRMKNIRSKFHVTLSEFQSTHRLLLTGTPLQNNLSELWSLLNFLLPKIFTSVGDFELWFEEPFKDFPGQECVAELTEEEKFLIINRLHSVLRPFLLRRIKADVLEDLPEKREYTIRVQLSAWQKVAYEQLSKKALRIQTAEGKVSLRTYANVMMQLRKVVNHPYLFENEYFLNDNIYRVSGKFEVLDRMLPKLIRFKHKTLIFCQMTQLMDILDDYLEIKGYKRCRLDGSTLLDDRRDRMAQFNDPLSDTFIFTLSTRAGGLGLNLQAADTVIIFDSDWNPHQDLQAQARAHRVGQKNEVRVFRLVTVSGVEEAVLSKAQHKLDIDEKIIQAGMFNNRCTDEERQEKLRFLLYSKDIERERRVTAPQTLNRFLARSEEEREWFQSYDESLFGTEAFLAFEENCIETTTEAKLEAEQHHSISGGGVEEDNNQPLLRPQRSKRRCLTMQEDVVDSQPRKRRKVDDHKRAGPNKKPSSQISGHRVVTRSSLAGLLDKEESMSNVEENWTGLVTEEALLIKSNRLISPDEVPTEWLMSGDVEEISKMKELERSARKGRTSVLGRIDTDVLSEAAFARALRRLETGEVADFDIALALEKTKLESRRPRADQKRRSHQKDESNNEEDGSESGLSCSTNSQVAKSAKMVLNEEEGAIAKRTLQLRKRARRLTSDGVNQTIRPPQEDAGTPALDQNGLESMDSHRSSSTKLRKKQINGTAIIEKEKSEVLRVANLKKNDTTNFRRKSKIEEGQLLQNNHQQEHMDQEKESSQHSINPNLEKNAHLHHIKEAPCTIHQNFATNQMSQICDSSICATSLDTALSSSNLCIRDATPVSEIEAVPETQCLESSTEENSLRLTESCQDEKSIRSKLLSMGSFESSSRLASGRKTPRSKIRRAVTLLPEESLTTPTTGCRDITDGKDNSILESPHAEFHPSPSKHHSSGSSAEISPLNIISKRPRCRYKNN